MEGSRLGPVSAGLLQFTVFTNVSNLGDTVSLGLEISPRGRPGWKGAQLSAPE